MTELVPHQKVAVAYPDSVGMIISKDGVDAPIYRPAIAFHVEDGTRIGHLIKKPKDDRIKLVEQQFAAGGIYDGYIGAMRDFWDRPPSYYDDYLRSHARYGHAADDIRRAAQTTARDAEETARLIYQSYGFVTPKTEPSAFRTIINITDPRGGEAGDQHA